MASLSIDYVVLDGTDVKIGWSASGLSSTKRVYVVYYYAVKGSREIYLGESSSFSGPSDSDYDWLSGLDAGTTYKFRVKLYNTSDEYTGVSYTTVNSYTTESSAYYQRIFYHSGDKWTYQDIDEYGYLKSSFNDPDGYTFQGWATRSGTTRVTYDEGEYYEATSNNDIDLYAVYKKSTTFYCYYGVNGPQNSRYNTRTATSYMYNDGDYTRVGTSSSITLPNFNPSTMTVLGRTFTAIGWRMDAYARAETYSQGETVDPDPSVTFYAVYSNSDGIKVTYNANGGSGSMSGTTVSGTLYYNTSGRNTTINVTPRTCTFTPPTGKKFVGWSTSADGSNIVDSLDTVYNVTFYAIWESDRPSNWVWSPAITQGSKISITAAHWNDFITRIQAFADYKGVTLSSATKNSATATKGSTMMASQANAVRTLISNLPIKISLPSSVSTGDTITAAFMNGIMQSLNSIP